MNNERYLRLLSGGQEGFNTLWNEFVKYAAKRAIERGIFHAEEAAYGSLNEIEDDLRIKGKMPESWGLAMTIIDRNLIDYKRKDKFESVADYELRSGERNTKQGVTVRDEKASIDESIVDCRVYKVADKHGYPRVRILDLPEGTKRDICLDWWQSNLTQEEIARKRNVSQPFVSQVISEYSK